MRSTDALPETIGSFPTVPTWKPAPESLGGVWGFEEISRETQVAAVAVMVVSPPTVSALADLPPEAADGAIDPNTTSSITPAARVLVMLEQFAGVFYIAVVVSRLIGLTILRRERNGGP